MDNLITEISAFIIGVLQETDLKKFAIDVDKVKTTVSRLIETTVSKLDKASEDKILAFIKNQALFQNCIIPNVKRIMADGRIAVDDIPAFLSLMVGMYENVNEFVQNNKTITISSNDIIELCGLLVKILICLLVKNESEVSLAIPIIDMAIKLVETTVKAKTCSFKLCCFK